MAPVGQLRIDRDVSLPWEVTAGEECAARRSLRAQVTKLERELSALVAGGFPHARPEPHVSGRSVAGGSAHGRSRERSGPRLQSLAELERQRDRLVVDVREAQREARRRGVRQREAREQLERMRAHPGRYKFARLPVTALGERGCGVWEVRPRLGLIGMLSGWWELKLSSGCPLATGIR